MKSPESFDPENSDTEVEVELEPNPIPRLTASERFSHAVTQLKAWYTALPVPAKVAVAVVGAILTLSAVTTILRLVSAVLSVLVLGAILFLLYRYVIKPNDSQ
jgi:hypothetical protein